MFVGYETNSKAYRLWQKGTKNIIKYIKLTSSQLKPLTEYSDEMNLKTDQPEMMKFADDIEGAGSHGQCQDQQIQNESVENEIVTLKRKSESPLRIDSDMPNKGRRDRPKIMRTGERGRPKIVRNRPEQVNLAINNLKIFPLSFEDVM